MSMSKIYIFLDGRIVYVSRRCIEPLAPGILQAKGVFETMLACLQQAGKKDWGRPVILAFEEHMKRMEKGLRLLGIDNPFSSDSLEEIMEALLEKNRIHKARVRVSVWQDKQGIRSAIICQPFYSYSKDKYIRGFSAIISSRIRKKNRFSHIKTFKYSCFYEAFAEANSSGYDEAILLNSKGELVEGARTNLFWIKNGVLFTPAVRCGCLNGITRRLIIRCARSTGISCRAVSAGCGDLLNADEAFLTNSLHGLMPLVRVGADLIGSGRPGIITMRLADAYAKLLNVTI